MLYRGIGNDRISHIGEHSPNVAHSAAKLFRTACTGNKISFTGVETSHKGSDTRAYDESLGLVHVSDVSCHTSNMVHGDPKLIESL